MAPGAQAQPFCVPQDEATGDVQHPENVLCLSSLRRSPFVVCRWKREDWDALFTEHR